jgi:hypothetical protein
MTKYLLIIAFLLLSACSDDPYKKYLGLWERQKDSGRDEVMEITKDGETFLMTDNVFGTKSPISGKIKPSKPVVLKKLEGQLSVATPFGGFPFGLSENEDTLRVADQSYKRIDENRLNDIKAKIEQKKIERKKNIEVCNNVKATYKVEKQKVAETYKDDWQVKAVKSKELMDKHFEKIKSLPDCAAW